MIRQKRIDSRHLDELKITLKNSSMLFFAERRQSFLETAMKSCPTCNRTFEDTMSFCLVDGSILSAPFDPNARRREVVPLPETAPPNGVNQSTSLIRTARLMAERMCRRRTCEYCVEVLSKARLKGVELRIAGG